MLRAVDITKTINNKIILNKINIDLNVGEIKILIGPSGSGKSTILSCISNVEKNYSGHIIMDNTKDTANYSNIGFVFQGLFLRPHMSIKENIILPLKKRGNIDFGYYNYIIKLLKIENILHKFPYNCSGGEKQRVALARQILLRPKYLLLDEVTSALDIEHIQTIANLLVKIKSETGILIVTHLINFAKQIGDYIYFIDQGETIEEGLSNILEFPKTKRLSSFLSFQ